MSDLGEFWREQKEEQKARRAARVPVRSQAILDLVADGYDVVQKTAYHFRVNNRIDLWPTHNRWHDLKTQKRGGAKDLAEFVRKHIRPDEYKRKLSERGN